MSHGALDLVIKPVSDRPDDLVEELYARNTQQKQEYANVLRGIKDYQMRKKNRHRAKERKERDEEEKMKRMREKKRAKMNIQEN